MENALHSQNAFRSCERECEAEVVMRMTRVVILLMPVSMLAACAAPVQPVPVTVETPGMPNPEIALHTTMLDVHNEMAQLDGIVPSPAPSPTPVVPADLNRVVSFSWKGSLDQAVAKLALSIGYTFYLSAPPATQPMNVSINVDSVPVYDIFQMLGNDAGSRATVSVDPLNHQVEVMYHA
jgi:defect-in-organelle-trafficking protein DotD